MLYIVDFLVFALLIDTLGWGVSFHALQVVGRVPIVLILAEEDLIDRYFFVRHNVLGRHVSLSCFGASCCDGS